MPRVVVVGEMRVVGACQKLIVSGAACGVCSPELLTAREREREREREGEDAR